MADYIPAADPAFDTWQGNFVTYANANLAGVGLVAGDMLPITAGQISWTTGYAAHVTATAGAQAARQTKDFARTSDVAAIRPLVRLPPQPATLLSSTNTSVIGP